MFAAFIAMVVAGFNMLTNAFAAGEELTAAARRAAEVTHLQVDHWAEIKTIENKAEYAARQAQLKLLDEE